MIGGKSAISRSKTLVSGVELLLKRWYDVLSYLASSSDAHSGWVVGSAQRSVDDGFVEHGVEPER